MLPREAVQDAASFSDGAARHGFGDARAAAARAAAPAGAAKAAQREEHRAFMALHGEVVATIMADVAELAMPAPTVAWLERMLAYTVAGGKMTRGLLVPQVRGAPAASPRL